MTRKTAFDRSKPEMLKGLQIRAARALLDWSIPEAAQRCGIGANTIRRFEKGERSPGGDILQGIVQAFEENGVLFIDTDAGAGVLMIDRPVPLKAHRPEASRSVGSSE